METLSNKSLLWSHSLHARRVASWNSISTIDIWIIETLRSKVQVGSTKAAHDETHSVLYTMMIHHIQSYQSTCGSDSSYLRFDDPFART